MKKFLAIAASVALSVSMLGFAACGDDDKDSDDFKADYKAPANKTELDDALANVKDDTPFGDPTQTGYKSGLEAEGKFNASLSMQGISVEEELALGYKMSMSAAGYKGSGTASAKGKLSVGAAGSTTTSEHNYSANVYNDNLYIYGDINSGSENVLKGKLELDEILGDFLAEPFDDDDKSLFEILAEAKVDVGLDTSDGLKLKLTATQDTLWQMLLDDDMTIEEAAEFKAAFVVNKFAAEAYLQFDKDGYFSKAMVKTDIDLEIDLTKIKAMLPADELNPMLSAYLTGTVELKLNGSATVKLYQGDVTLPEGLATDPLYIDYTDILDDYVDNAVPDLGV